MASRAKAAQIAAVPLLLLLVGLWMMPRHAPLPTPILLHAITGSSAVPVGSPPATAPAIAAPWTLPSRDPFQPPTTVSPATEMPGTRGGGGSPGMAQLRLQGIIWGVSPPRAIVNDRVLTTGESIDGARVMAIDPEGITIEYQGQRVVLRLPSSPAVRHD